MKTFFISDTHFCHTNILKYDNRPFSSIEEHDENLIENWNSRVTNKDIVYHLGDFGFGQKDKLQDIFNRLKGRKRLIRGNHDYKYDPPKGWEWEKDLYMAKVAGKKILLCHYPLAALPRCHYHLYGHTHLYRPYQEVHGSVQQVPCWNMYLGNWDWRPVTLDEIIATGPRCAEG